jgi:hypothetical protein
LLLGLDTRILLETGGVDGKLLNLKLIGCQFTEKRIAA